MLDRRKLAEVVTRPPYASMDAIAVVNALRPQTQPGDVQLGELNQMIDNMANGSGVPVWELIKKGELLETPFGVACRMARQLLRDSRPDYPGVNTRSPTFTANIDLLVAGEALTPAQGDELKRKSDNLRTVAQAEGLSRPPIVSEVVAVRGS